MDYPTRYPQPLRVHKQPSVEDSGMSGASVCRQGIAGFLIRINLNKAGIVNSKIIEKKNSYAVHHVAMAKAIGAIEICPFYIDP